MTTPKSNARSIRSSEKDALVLRLERYQKEVGQLRQKLNCYTCEPTTYSLFERIEALKTGLDSLSSRNKEILTSLKHRRKSMDEYVDRVRQHLSEFTQLQHGVEDYMEVARH